MKKSLIITLLLSSPFIITLYALIYTSITFAPMTSFGAMIPAAATINCKMIDHHGYKDGFVINFYSYSQWVYERFLSTADKTIDGHSLIAEAFIPYGLLGERCDRDIITMAEKYIERGADVNAFNGNPKRPALHMAIISGKVEGAAFLLRHGADICYKYTNSRDELVTADKVSKALYKHEGKRQLQMHDFILKKYADAGC